MAGNEIRLLRAGEIECRVSVIKENGLSLLLYKDARVDQRILDETFGAFGWKRSHQCIDGNLYCTVEVYDKEKGMWVAKQDVGTVGFAEKEKSQASDSFKRACFNWGIGRELYTAPFIWIPSSKARIQKKGDKYCCSEHFTLTSIAYSPAREISGIEIANKDGDIIFQWKNRKAQEEKQQEGKRPAGKQLTRKQMESLETELKRTGVGMAAVQDRYGIDKPEKMGAEIYERVMNALAKTRSIEAA